MMVVIAHHRQMNMQEVLTYPLGPLPWSLATADGEPTKTAKSALYVLDAITLLHFVFFLHCSTSESLGAYLIHYCSFVLYV